MIPKILLLYVSIRCNMSSLYISPWNVNLLTNTNSQLSWIYRFTIIYNIIEMLQIEENKGSQILKTSQMTMLLKKLK